VGIARTDLWVEQAGSPRGRAAARSRARWDSAPESVSLIGLLVVSSQRFTGCNPRAATGRSPHGACSRRQLAGSGSDSTARACGIARRALVRGIFLPHMRPRIGRSTSEIRVRLLSAGEDDPTDRETTPAARLAMMWQLSLDAWEFKGEPVRKPGLSRRLVRALRGGR
jgi:hypothetical protein